MSHTILPHHVRRMFIFQLCCHFIVTTLEKKDSIYIKTKESLNDLLVGQTSYCIRGLVVIRARFLHFHPQQCEEDNYYSPCLHHIHLD